MRFAMYADPISTTKASYFQLYINKSLCRSDSAYNIPNDIFQNWAQTHYATGDSIVFLQKLKPIQIIKGNISIVKTIQYE